MALTAMLVLLSGCAAMGTKENETCSQPQQTRKERAEQLDSVATAIETGLAPLVAFGRTGAQ